MDKLLTKSFKSASSLCTFVNDNPVKIVSIHNCTTDHITNFTLFYTKKNTLND